MQYTMGLLQSFVTQKKIYTHKNAEFFFLKRQYENTFMVSPVIDNLAVFFSF